MGSKKSKVNIGIHIFLSICVFTVISFPFVVRAVDLCFFGFFCRAEAETRQSGPNSQTIALLQAPLSPQGSSAATSSKDIAIVNENSLVSESTTAPTSKEHSVESDQISIYVVRSGDTLPAIAKMFGVTTNTIVWANDIKGKTITPGQTLVILPISGVQHIVKKGDTLKSIATQYKGDVDEILQYNNLSKDSKLAIGDIVVIPDGEVVAVVNVKTPSKTTTSTSGGISVTAGYYSRPLIGGLKSQGLHGHNGVDLASSYGSNILAAAAGTVIVSKNSGWNGGYGSYIVIQHGNGTQTLYGHLSGTTVNVGDQVDKGQTIGYMGSTGNSTGVHVHFEVRGAKNPF